MRDADDTHPLHGPPPPLSPDALSRLGGLLAGLDRLDPILALPAHPRTADPRLELGRYLLRSRLGEGAHGVVLLADDPRLGRRVVVKVPQPSVLADPGSRGRFVREARAAAALDHPGVVPVFEAGEAGGLPYLAAGFIDGPTLGEWLAERGGPAAPAEAARLVRLIAEAVHHAHERGVLHCDLKPGNVLLVRGDRGEWNPVVTDFGLARVLTDDPTATRTFELAGTPAYMAPEQARGDRRNLTARTDVYALGVILHELLTGCPPFPGGSGAEVLERVRTQTPPCPGESNPGVPRDLRAVCRKCLAKDPADRYEAAAALAADLARFLAGQPVTARPVGPVTRAARWVRRNPLAAVTGVVLLGLLAGCGVLLADRWARGVRHEVDLRAAAADLRAEAAERAEAEQRAAAGEFLVTLERVRRRRTELEPGWPVDNLVDLPRLAASPVAADHLPALRTEAAAALGGTDLGTPRAVAVGFRPYSLAFSPDGAALALGSWLNARAGRCAVRLVDPATGADRRTLPFPADLDWEKRYGAARKQEPSNLDTCTSLAFSPDGRWLVAGTRSGWLVRWDLTAADPKPVRWRNAPPAEHPGQDRVRQLAFTPTGGVLVSADDLRTNLWDARGDWRHLAGFGQSVARIVRQVQPKDELLVRLESHLYRVTDEPPFLANPAPCTGGVVAAGPSAELLFGWGDHPDVPRPFDPRTGRGMGAFPLPAAGAEGVAIGDMAVSPDGRFLATGAEHAGQLKLWDVASGEVLSSRTLVGGSLRLAFSPDGTTLAVCEDCRTLLYRLTIPEAVRTVGLHPYPIADADVAGNRAVMTVIDSENRTMVWTVPDLTPAGWARSAVLHDRGGPVVNNNSRRVALDPGGPRFAFSAGDGMWVRAGGSTAERAASNLRELKFGPYRWLWGAAGDLVGWRTDGSEVRRTLSPISGTHAPHPNALAVSGSSLFVGRSDGAVSRHKAATGEPLETTPLFGQPVRSLAVGDGLLAAGDSLGGVRVVRLDGGAVVADLPNAHRDVVSAIAVGPGGWFATGGRDRVVRVWDSSGRPVLALPQSRTVRRLFVSPDGRGLTILAEGERGLRRWDLDALRSNLSELGLNPGFPPN